MPVRVLVYWQARWLLGHAAASVVRCLSALGCFYIGPHGWEPAAFDPFPSPSFSFPSSRFLILEAPIADRHGTS
jgi:hypothetical protein